MVLLFGGLGCAEEAELYPSGTADVVHRSSPDELLRAELELLRDGMAGIAADPELRALAHELVLLNSETGEYEVSLAHLTQSAAEVDLDLNAALVGGVIARGGSDAQAQHAASLIDGFTVDGVTLEPTIYVPQLDISYFDLEDWHNESPELIATTRSFEGEELVAVQLDGPELTVGEAVLTETPTWFASVRPVDLDDPSPERLWARCYCSQSNPDEYGNVGAVCSTTSGSSTTQGRCGRTGLFSNHCNGHCF
jgi:hypothetical protein